MSSLLDISEVFVSFDHSRDSCGIQFVHAQVHICDIDKRGCKKVSQKNEIRMRERKRRKRKTESKPILSGTNVRPLSARIKAAISNEF